MGAERDLSVGRDVILVHFWTTGIYLTDLPEIQMCRKWQIIA